MKLLNYLVKCKTVIDIIPIYDVLLRDVFKSNEVDRESEKIKNVAEIAGIDKKLQTLVLKSLDGVIDDDTYQATKEVLQNQKNEYLIKRGSLKNLPDEFTNYLTYGFSLIGNLSNYYSNADVKTKKR